MAEEQASSAGATKRRSATQIVIYVAGAVLIAAIGAMLLYLFLLRPMLAPAEPVAQPAVPTTAAWVEFDQANATAVMPPGANVPATLVLYKVSFLCANPETAALVEANKAWFADMLRELHSGHPRESLDDPLLQRSIKRQALARANEIIGTLVGPDQPLYRVLDVFHREFFFVDQ